MPKFIIGEKLFFNPLGYFWFTAVRVKRDGNEKEAASYISDSFEEVKEIVCALKKKYPGWKLRIYQIIEASEVDSLFNFQKENEISL